MWNNIILLFFAIYFVFIVILILVGFFLQLKKENENRTDSNNIKLEELVVLIPFRNEKKRIFVLLEAIKELKKFPKTIIFIDDHSEDETAELITSELLDVPHSILKLPSNHEGKKMALRYGINNSSSAYILTLDADVKLTPNYFTEIANLASADMYILPAIMKAQKFPEYFYELDLVLANAVNTGLSGLKRPIIASGANLLYRRSTFEKVDNLEAHKHAASGDDTYLLRDFRENKADVRLSSDSRLAVYTETPQSFREFINQRLRWIGKTGDLKDHLSTSIAILQAFLNLGFIGLIVANAYLQNWNLLFIIYGLKVIIDLLLFAPYFNRIKRMATWLFIPLYELFFPFYVLTLLILMFTYKPKWKDRPIYKD